MKRLLFIVCLWLSVLPIAAQVNDVPISAGTDFYFTVFDNTLSSPNSKQHVILQVVSTGLTDMTMYVNGQQQGIINGFQTCYTQVEPRPGDVVHLTTTQPCYVVAFAKASTSGAETAILPTHLLGSSYMLQSVSGSMIELNGTPTKTYAQFSVVATENGTRFTIQPPVDLTCTTTGQTIQAGTKTTFTLAQGRAYLFQPVDYLATVSGVQVKSNLPVAVFQGNGLTRIPSDTNWSDCTWEQARPITNWGTEFIVPMSSIFRSSVIQVTALQDNTELYWWTTGNKMHVKTMRAGETYSRTTFTGVSPNPVAEHLQTSKPACCYLYFTGYTINMEKGDPAMVEIAPMDNPSTDTRWCMSQPDDNAPYVTRLLVTMHVDDINNILLNNYPVSIYASGSVRSEDYITYECAYSAYQTMHLQALEGGFSAYTMHVGKTAEASAFNVALPEIPSPQELCLDGQLIFKEDFGGNDPSDPVVSTTPVPGMSSSYRQITNLETKNNDQDMTSGRYLVAKRGYRNSTYSNYSVWHIMDDHTYFEDTTRGYFVEVDGRGDNTVFYSTTIDGLCPGSQMSFSAWVANLTTAGQYNGWRYDRGYVHPKLTFVITDPSTDQIVAQYNTDTIAHDWSLFNTPSAWKQSAHWQQVGMNFIVPEGVSSLKLSIRNAVRSDAAGNDFALDDIEVRLCVPPVTIIAPDTVCVDTKNMFIADLENNGTFEEPLQYQWYFSADSIAWTPLDEGHQKQLKLKAKPRHTGWYKVAVAGSGNINNEKCRSVSEPHKFFVIEECPPILCPDGILIFREEFSSPETSCNAIIPDLCAGSDLSLIVNLPSSHAETRLMLRLTDPDTGNELMAYDTGDVPSDSLQVGTSFTIPEGVSSLRWTINNNAAGAAGQPFTIDNIEIRLCMEPISISSVNPACRKKSHTFYSAYENWGTLESPEFMWTYSADSLTWTELQRGVNKNYTIPTVHRSHEGWYKVSVANAGNLDMHNCRSESEPFKLETKYCNTAVDQYIDTTACDTLLEYDLHWRGHSWPEIGTVIDTLRDIDIDDSLYIHLTLDTKICCPDIQTFRIDSAVCDTLLPFMWFFRDTMALFTDIGEQELPFIHHRWENCIGEIVTLALDTFHCERLYPIIVNKYNWQLLLDYTSLRRFFPERQYLAFQWYKNGEPIVGAIDDDYAEQNELCGFFQLCIKLDEPVDNHDEYIWSNVLEIGEVENPHPVQVRIYDSHGFLMPNENLPQGIYLILYQQGDKFRTEKKYIR